MAADFFISRLHTSERTRAKLAEKHQLTEEQVRLHVQGVEGLVGSWHLHPERGWRLLLTVPMNARTVLVVLYPRDDEKDAWNLGSAYPI